MTMGSSRIASVEIRTAREEFRADWPLLLAAMMGTGLSAVLAFAIGVVMGPIRKEFGWNAETVLLGLTLSGFLSALGAPFSGRLMVWSGARNLVLTGTIVLALATMALGLIPNSLPAYLACYVVVAIGHTTLSPIIWQKMVVERFVTARGLAVSIVLCGPSIAGAISPILATLAIEHANWHVAYFALAGYMLVSSLPLTFFFFRENTPERTASDGATPAQARVGTLSGLSLSQARKTREFWLMCTSFAFAGIGMGGYTVHLIPMLTHQGLTLLLAASVVSGLSIAAVGGRLLAGAFIDHVFAPRVAAAALALPLVGSVILLTYPGGYWAAFAAAILVGIASGAEYNMIGYLTARYFGLRDFGTIGGTLFGLFAFGCLAGQQLPALILHRGTYDNVIMLFGASFLAASVTMLFCRPYPEAMPEILSGDQVTEFG